MSRPRIPKHGSPDKNYPATIQATTEEIKKTKSEKPLLNELQALIEAKVEEAVLWYETKILPVLHELDKMGAGIAYAMMQQRISDSITERFDNAWFKLKRLIYEIERREFNSDDKETDQQ